VGKGTVFVPAAHGPRTRQWPSTPQGSNDSAPAIATVGFMRRLTDNPWGSPSESRGWANPFPPYHVREDNRDQ
jgi:hypothetical protein